MKEKRDFTFIPDEPGAYLGVVTHRDTLELHFHDGRNAPVIFTLIRSWEGSGELARVLAARLREMANATENWLGGAAYSLEKRTTHLDGG